MSEFIFPCPQCNKDIQCDESYAGMQINCPICQAPIVVPQPSAPPTPAPLRPSQMIGSAGRTAYQAPPPKKSGALRTTLIIVAIVVVLAALGGGGWYFYSKHKEKAAAGNPAAQVAAPNAQATIQALSVLSKVQSAYTNLTSVKADATITLSLDLSKITLADVSPGAPANQNANQHPRGMPNNVALNMDFSMKSAQSNWYCISGDVVVKADGTGGRATTTTMTNTFASWSSDKGKFMFTDSHQRGMQPSYIKLPDSNPADNVAEQIKNMQQLFKDPANLNKIVKDLGQTADEPVNGQDCHTLTAKMLGQKIKIWVDKTSYMVSQLEITVGGAISDADIDDAFSLVAAGITNLPPAALDMAKVQVKTMTPVVTKIRGTITMTYKNFEMNPALAPDEFNYPVPAGVRLR